MESIFYIALSTALVAILGMNLYLLKIISKMNALIDKKLDALPDIIKEDIHRSLLPKEHLEAAKPIRPNNWDSVKEAFKGPVRIDERVRTI